MADHDIADVFLNFQLHAEAVPYTRVDLGPMYEEGESIGDMMWACWDRNLLRFTASPYNSVTMAIVAEEDRTERGKLRTFPTVIANYLFSIKRITVHTPTAPA